VGDIEFLIAVLFAAAVLVRLADRVSIPYPIALVIGGVAIGFIPGLPDIGVDPDVVFLVFLPPLLASSGFNASPQELRAAAHQVASLALGLTLVTMGAVAVVAHEVVPGLGWPAAFVLGAIVAPTDPVSAVATFRRLGVPQPVALAVETEAMLNDATALVAYRVAVTATVSGSFALGGAAVDFVASALGGLAVGLAVGWAGQRIQRRLDDVPLAVFLSVLFAYGSYIGAEEIGASGVLAAVTTGLWFGWHAHDMYDADTRLNTLAFWQALVFGLEATLFVLLGLQLENVVNGLEPGLAAGELAAYVAVISATVIGARFVWIALPPLLGRVVPVVARADTGESWRERIVVGWSGMRGAISLAAALSLPATLEGGAPFPERDLLIFLTIGVIAVTLVGQGLTLPALMRVLRVRGERGWSPDEAIARLEAAQAALDRLDELEAAGRISAERLRRLRELYQARFARCMAVIGGEDGRPDGEPPPQRFGDLRRELIGVERDKLLELRNAGRLRPDVVRQIERDLDLEEARLPG
jgi:CPA1 family monovalent cation:H+ antiporter